MSPIHNLISKINDSMNKFGCRGEIKNAQEKKHCNKELRSPIDARFWFLFHIRVRCGMRQCRENGRILAKGCLYYRQIDVLSALVCLV